MPTFRCFGLTGENRIVWGRHVEAPDITSAIIGCTEVAPAQTARIEVWLGAIRIYPRASLYPDDTDHGERAAFTSCEMVPSKRAPVKGF